MTVQLASVLVICIGIVLFLIAGAFFLLYRTFEYNKQATDRVMAFLIDVNHKKDVPVYGASTLHGPIRVRMILKHYSKGLYEYTVNQKRYAIRYAEQVTARQMPRMVSVMYLKKFPKIAYVKTDTGVGHEVTSIWAIVFFFGGLLFVGNGLIMMMNL